MSFFILIPTENSYFPVDCLFSQNIYTWKTSNQVGFASCCHFIRIQLSCSKHYFPKKNPNSVLLYNLVYWLNLYSMKNPLWAIIWFSFRTAGFSAACYILFYTFSAYFPGLKVSKLNYLKQQQQKINEVMCNKMFLLSNRVWPMFCWKDSSCHAKSMIKCRSY